MATLILIILILMSVAIAFIIKTLLGINGNILDSQKKVEAFEKAYQKDRKDDELIRKTTATALKRLSDNLYN